ncbi:pilus assembly protein, partial [Bradyrhizobium jicamae]
MTRAAFWPDTSGASALEFGLIAPVFFAFLFGVIEFGLLMWTQVGMQHAVEVTARCASVNPTLCPTTNPNQIATYATRQAFGLTLPSSTFTYSTAACGSQVSAN